jgi:hypothetical protein
MPASSTTALVVPGIPTVHRRHASCSMATVSSFFCNQSADALIDSWWLTGLAIQCLWAGNNSWCKICTSLAQVYDVQLTNFRRQIGKAQALMQRFTLQSLESLASTL